MIPMMQKTCLCFFHYWGLPTIQHLTRLRFNRGDFLQCSEPAAFNFYVMIGFRRMNKIDKDDGFNMLPNHMQTALESQKPSAFLRCTS
jgi:hypothetical protein